MLIEFTVGNFRSFRDPQTLSMVAASLRSKDEEVDRNNVFQIENQPSLLTSAAIYGANASGKSNLIRALSFMRGFVMRSTRDTKRTGGIDVEPFLLNTNTSTSPSFFEVVFISNGKRYRYGFEVSQESVSSEWLFTVPTTREARLFEREGDRIEIGPRFREARELIELTRPNALFLSVAAQFNNPVAVELLNWFRELRVDGGNSDTFMRRTTMRQLEQERFADDVRELVQRLDLGISSLSLEEQERELPPFFEDLPKDEQELYREAFRRRPSLKTVRTSHAVYDDEGQSVREELFDLDHHESDGTRKLFALAGPVLNALRYGLLLVIDEFDARLHPLMTRELVQLFNSVETNPRHAQLIFTTQDTNLLDSALFRRDQIWFVEKERRGASQLYSLAEFKGVRNDLSLERNYIQGRFGAIPYLNLRKLLTLVAEEYVKEPETN